MIDIHTHIMPDVDDGAETIEDSIEIIKKAESEGIKIMVATPHINPSYFFKKESFYENKKKLEKTFNTLLEVIEQRGVNVQLYYGSEIYFDPIIKEKLIPHKKILTINNGDYFLLEFPINFVHPGIKQFVFDVMTLGFIPIIAHPEKNQMFQNDMNLLYQLLAVGALCQVDADSFLGNFSSSSRSTAFKLLRNNMVHIIATDCHDVEYRPPEYSFLYNILKKFGKEKIDMYINRIPEAIINNTVAPDIGIIEDPSVKKFFFEGFFK